MSNNYDKPGFKNLLQKLQEESWQLELLISGFAIFGLFSAFEPLELLFKKATNENIQIIAQAYVILLISCSILIFNLLLHVVLRGLWIGALGLRYVSGDIDYDTLNYSEKFTKYLKKRVGSFDRYIGRLEDYCSIIFAISFLLVFYVIAFFLTFFAIGITVKYLITNESLGIYGKIIGIPIVVFLVIGMLMVFIDFATQGWLKRKKWLSKIYFPFYLVFHFITLSFIYRPLVYNFLDNKFGRRISWLLLPLYILILLATSLNHKTSNYFNNYINSSTIIADASNYDDLLLDEKDFVKNVSIPSKVITKHYLKLFMTFDDYIEDDIFAHQPSLKPEEDIRGFSSDIVIIDETTRQERDSVRQLYIDTFNKVYSIKINDSTYASEFVFTENNKEQKGFETFVNIKNLPEGKHLLKLKRQRIRESDTTVLNLVEIPFWYYPD